MVNGALVNGTLLFEPMLTPLLGHSHLVNKCVSESFCKAIGIHLFGWNV